MKRVLAAGGIVSNEFGEILLIFRRSKWDLPKGHLEKGEAMENCALREVKEETGLKQVKIVNFIGVTEHPIHDYVTDTDAIKETHWFGMSALRNEPLNPQVQESIEWIRWVARDELVQYLRSSYRNIIDIMQQAGIIK